MGLVIALVLLAVILWLAGAAMGFALNIFLMLFIGLLIGAMARLLIPGKQNIGLLLTAVLGAIGSLGGGLLANAFNVNNNLIEFVFSVVAAIILVIIFAKTNQELPPRAN